MPLTAYLGTDAIAAPFLSDEEWAALRGSKAHLRFPCGVRALPWTSKLGLRHFHHERLADCDVEHRPESTEHLRTKAAIMLAARSVGWMARDEVPDGPERHWVADVLAEKDGRRIAFEVQWSRQTPTEYERRTDRYAADGVETVWFAAHASPTAPTSAPTLSLDVTSTAIGVTRSHTPNLPIDQAVRSLLAWPAYWRTAATTRAHGLVPWGVHVCRACHKPSMGIARLVDTFGACPDCATTARVDNYDLLTDVAVAAARRQGLEGIPRTVAEGEAHWRCPSCRAAFRNQEMAYEPVDLPEIIVPAHWCMPGYALDTPAVTADCLGDTTASKPGARHRPRAVNAAVFNADLARATVKLRMKQHQADQEMAELLQANRAKAARRAIERAIYDRAAAARGAGLSQVVTNQTSHDVTESVRQLLGQGMAIMTIAKCVDQVVEPCICVACDAIRRSVSNDARTILLGG